MANGVLFLQVEMVVETVVIIVGLTLSVVGVVGVGVPVGEVVGPPVGVVGVPVDPPPVPDDPFAPDTTVLKFPKTKTRMIKISTMTITFETIIAVARV